MRQPCAVVSNFGTAWYLVLLLGLDGIRRSPAAISEAVGDDLPTAFPARRI
jgi:hypothetical protein